MLFGDLERGTDGLSLNEVDWLTNHLLTSGVEIYDDVQDTIKNGPGFKQAKIQGHPIGTLLFLKYKTLKATGRMVLPKGFVVYKGSEYNEVVTSSCTIAIGNKRSDLMQSGKMKDRVLTEDVQFGSPLTVAKVLIGNSANGNIVWVDSNGYTLKQFLAENEKRTNGE